MKVAANNSQEKFGSVFLDEALDGLDSDLKIKSYSLLQDLAKDHDSVLVIDHATELKEMFERKYKVAMENGGSVIEQS